MRIWNALVATCGFAAIFLCIFAIGVLLAGALDVILNGRSAASRVQEHLSFSIPLVDRSL